MARLTKIHVPAKKVIAAAKKTKVTKSKKIAPVATPEDLFSEVRAIADTVRDLLFAANKKGIRLSFDSYGDNEVDVYGSTGDEKVGGKIRFNLSLETPWAKKSK